VPGGDPSASQAAKTLIQAWMDDLRADGALEVVRDGVGEADRIRRYDRWPGATPPTVPGDPLGDGFVVRGSGAAVDRALGSEAVRGLLRDLPPGAAIRWASDGLFVELPREGWFVDATTAAGLGAVAARVGALAEALRATG
jgi:hypothetical protein